MDDPNYRRLFAFPRMVKDLLRAVGDTRVDDVDFRRNAICFSVKSTYLKETEHGNPRHGPYRLVAAASIPTETAIAASDGSGAAANTLSSLPPDLVPFITPIMIVLTAIVAWRVQLNILARRTAWDYITQHQLQTDYIETMNKARRALARKDKLSHWEEFAASWSQSNLTEAEELLTTPIFDWLNRQEFVAITILNGSMHAATYANLWGVEFIYAWKSAAGFLEALRNTQRGDPDLYSQFERLAKSPKFRRLSRWDELTGGTGA